MRSAQTFVLFLLNALALVSASETFDVYHNLNPSEFVQRGELRVLDDGTTAYQAVSIQHPPVLPTDEIALPDASKQYALVLRSSKTGSQYVLPVDRCRLGGQKKVDEVFIVHEDEQNEPFHIDYSAGSRESCKGGLGVESNLEFVTKIMLRKREVGAAPKLAFAATIDTATGKEQKPEEDKGFFAKYWYYIVPVMLLLLVSGDDGQQAEGNTRK
ncbi:hypothetical protein FBU59_002800 [Linderina macrospora]|uniref:Uncharacterized protein n=1 Tax=Linderina macrospora TaxID=4868 RepID=A0ACC1JAD5_9FUNG|nr:hypothetical protein FBU59_002800 [Linderina macrospora]